MEEVKPKKLGKKILTIVITIIITIFILLFIALTWLLIANPLNVRGIILYKIGWIDTPVKIFPVENSQPDLDSQVDEVEEAPGSVSDSVVPSTSVTPSTPAPQALPMTESQRQVVEDFGIDPNSVVITPAMEECFVEKLGQERVNEIIQGAIPGAFEMLKASSCL